VDGALNLSELVARTEQLTQSGSANYGHWDSTRKKQIINDAQYEVYKLLVETFEEVYFCDLKSGITATNGEINLDVELPKPFYRMIAFQRRITIEGGDFADVEVVTAREAWKITAPVVERWFVIGRRLKTDWTVTGNEYRIAYHYRIPKLVENGDECEIPPEFVEMVPLFAASIASLQAKAKDDYQHFLAEIERRKREMRSAASNRLMNRQMSVLAVAPGLGGPNNGRIWIRNTFT
jgi:hypothetical protein